MKPSIIPTFWSPREVVAVYSFLNDLLSEIQNIYREELAEAYSDPYETYPDPEEDAVWEASDRLFEVDDDF